MSSWFQDKLNSLLNTFIPISKELELQSVNAFGVIFFSISSKLPSFIVLSKSSSNSFLLIRGSSSSKIHKVSHLVMGNCEYYVRKLRPCFFSWVKIFDRNNIEKDVRWLVSEVELHNNQSQLHNNSIFFK